MIKVKKELNDHGCPDFISFFYTESTAWRKNVDVLFLQEMSSDEQNELDWDKAWEGQVLLSHISTASGGVLDVLYDHKQQSGE